MQRRPTPGSREASGGQKGILAAMLAVASHLPPIAVGGVSIDAKLDQELDDLGVSGANGVVQRGDALVVGCAGIVHLQELHLGPVPGRMVRKD